jgi:hypothetical protein
MTRYTLSIVLGASLGVTACSGNIDGGNTGDDNQGGDDTGGSTTGGDGTTFDHPNDGPSPFDIADRIHQEGPSSFSSQMASCSKIPYAVLGNLLASIGVDMSAAAQGNKLSAISLYKGGASSMGAPQYDSRLRENSQVTTSGASKLFDIFAAAAPEVIKNIGSLTRCQVNGVAPVLFDASNACHIEGISCLLGVPATQGHVELCNQAVKGATTTEIGKNIAVAALLAAAYTCD